MSKQKGPSASALIKDVFKSCRIYVVFIFVYTYSCGSLHPTAFYLIEQIKRSERWPIYCDTHHKRDLRHKQHQIPGRIWYLDSKVTLVQCKCELKPACFSRYHHHLFSLVKGTPSPQTPPLPLDHSAFKELWLYHCTRDSLSVGLCAHIKPKDLRWYD